MNVDTGAHKEVSESETETESESSEEESTHDGIETEIITDFEDILSI